MIRRRLFNFATKGSLVLCLGFLLAWQRSYSAMDQARFAVSTNDFYVFRSQFGIAELDRTACSSRNLPGNFHDQFWIQLIPQTLRVEWNARCKSVFGFGYRNEPLIFPIGKNLVVAATRSWSVPYWLCVVVTAVLPFLAIRKWLREQRPDACRECSYNLTGNVSGICPECGTAIVSPGATT